MDWEEKEEAKEVCRVCVVELYICRLRSLDMCFKLVTDLCFGLSFIKILSLSESTRNLNYLV